MSDERPRLRVVRGEPTPAELAALVTVLSALSALSALLSTARSESADSLSAWRDRSALLRKPLSPGPGAWRASALPR
ncbi:MAG: acyl-CoA carboxylase subunit epsilon [Carbonactinosporaceae bacterium]